MNTVQASSGKKRELRRKSKYPEKLVEDALACTVTLEARGVSHSTWTRTGQGRKES